jgi:hypothetical protein
MRTYESPCAQLVIRRILENHSDEIRANQEFAGEIFLMMFDKGYALQGYVRWPRRSANEETSI